MMMTTPHLAVPGSGPVSPSLRGAPGDGVGGAKADGASGSDQAGQPGSHAVGSGGDAAAATSRRGQGSLRNQLLREAERLTVEGDAVGGDKNVYLVGGRQRARLRMLSTRLIEPIKDAFVVPDGFGEIRAGFGKNHAVILRGPAGIGKQGVAIRMLIDLCPGPLIHLDRAVDLARLAEWIETDLNGKDRIEQGAGFVLDQPTDFASLYGSVLQGLDDALARAQARLVLTVGSDVPLPDSDLFDYVVDLTSEPSYDDIVASHLRFRLTSDQADRLLARADIREAIAEQLAAGASCKLAAGLAEAIADDAADADHEFDVGRIRAWRSRRGAEDFDTWFAGLGDTRSRCFAIALAVLNGLPYDAVARAARALSGRFDAAPYVVMASGKDIPPEARGPFRTSRREWLDRLRARVREVEVLGLYGHSPAEAVEYKDPGYAAKVIRWAWSDYEAQDVLLAWLGDLAEDESVQVQIFAGIALGQLATWSFDCLSVSVLMPWSVSVLESQRDAVAYALRVVAADPRLRENARQLISDWYASNDNPLLQATAARAYGVAYGPVDAAAAFQALDRLSAVDDIRVAIAIGDSVADLLEAGTDDFACSVLPKLADSARMRDRSATAQLVFLIVADGLDTRVQAGTAERPVSWPFLLHLTMRLAGVRSAIVELWQQVLNESLFHDEAGQVMTRWAGMAEGDAEVREAFLLLVRAIARGDTRSQMILGRYARLWASPGNLSPLPVVSVALQSMLSAESAERKAR
jgi:molybdopterin-guanine dinucleotide biosynthesis protein A